MLSEGLILENRYEVIGKIGAGGMSDVYKAKDHKLNRFVAIKVLKSEFSENKSFVSKFRVEAQSAAILTHPNIVNVYDVGQEMGFHYIVMELVEGITLKKYIEKKLRLSVKEAVSIAIQVSMGIEAAHNNHIIHRDIKPQNIIISREGKVKVTDFGIARAATSNTITSNAMGSVHYTSPEQARGGYSDEKSDIYSLGITMFEMVTGRVPFDGETTVAIAIKHIQENIPSPREFVDDIPVSVEAIIIKCCQKNAARRYQTMSELVVDLKKSLISPDEDFVKMVETQGAKTKMMTESDIRTIKRKTGKIELDEDMLLSSGRPKKRNSRHQEYADDIKEYMPKRSSTSREQIRLDYEDSYYDDGYEDEYAPGYQDGYMEPYATDNYYPEEDYYPEEEYYGSEADSYVRQAVDKRMEKRSDNRSSQKKSDAKPDKRPKNRSDKYESGYEEGELDSGMEKLMSIFAIIAAVIILGIAIFVVSKVFGVVKNTDGTFMEGFSGSAKEVTVPAVTGKNFEAAKTTLKDLGFEVQATYISSQAEKDQVIDQSIKAGKSVTQGTVIELSVSSGSDGVVIPDIKELSEAEARVKLENEGFVMVKDESASDSIPKGNVVSQNPAAGELAQKGATITVIISTGKSNEQVTVPDLALKTEEEAKALLKNINLNCGEVKEEPSDVVPVGMVITQTFAAGTTVQEGTSVGFSISRGPDIKLYKCNLTVQAPAAYVGGMAVVTLTQPDTGVVLFSTSTASFPVMINQSNIQGSPEAVVGITYTIPSTSITENEDGTLNSFVSNDEKTEYTTVTLEPQ